MVGNTSKNTADAQKAYKKAKKQRRKLRAAEQKKTAGVNGNKSSSSSSNNTKKWQRVTKEDGAKKAVDRPLEEGCNVDQINELLEQRSKAKEVKDYKVSDEITKTLVKLQIVYDDDKREWHTRAWKRGVDGGW